MRHIEDSKVTEEQIIVHPVRFDERAGRYLVEAAVSGTVEIHGVKYRFEHVIPIELDGHPSKPQRPHEARGSAASNACLGA